MFQCDHGIIYSLQICHLYNYNHVPNYTTIVIVKKLLSALLTLFDQFFKTKNMMWGFNLQVEYEGNDMEGVLRFFNI